MSDGVISTSDQQFHVEGESLLPFRIGNQCVAVPSSAVLTISDQVAIHSIPYNTSVVIKGLVAINHEVYTFIQLDKLLGIEVNKLNSYEAELPSLFIRTLVVDFSGWVVVFYVDEVYQIHRYSKSDIMPADNNIFDVTFLQGIVENKGPWCGKCHLLDMTLTHKHLAISEK